MFSWSYQVDIPEGKSFMTKAKKPLTSMVYDHVYASIINGEITCNDTLTESHLASRLEVSKAPVREALLMLCQKNLLRAIPRIGYRVVQISPAQLSKLMESRMVLEMAMLEKSWDSIGDAQIAQLTDIYHRQQEVEARSREVLNRWLCNIEFHLTLAGFSGNEYLQYALKNVLHTSAQAATQCFLGYRNEDENAEYHKQILQALTDRDLEAAKAALTGDIHALL